MRSGGYIPLSGKRLSTKADRMVALIRKSGVKFDAIAFRGMSGAILAPVVAMTFGKPLILVRKNKNHHSDEQIEGCSRNGGRYIIVDDFVASGKTIDEIVDGICDNHNYSMRPVGIFLYEVGSIIEANYVFEKLFSRRDIPVFYWMGKKIKKKIY